MRIEPAINVIGRLGKTGVSGVVKAVGDFLTGALCFRADRFVEVFRFVVIWFQFSVFVYRPSSRGREVVAHTHVFHIGSVLP